MHVKHSWKIGAVVLVLWGGQRPALHAADYLGAQAVLQQLTGNSAPTKKSKADEDADQLRAQFDSFVKGMGRLDSKELARQWLELFDASSKTVRPRFSRNVASTNAVTLEEVAANLPPPPAWADLASLVAQRKSPSGSRAVPEAGLKLLAAALGGNTNAWDTELAALQTTLQSRRDESRDFELEQALRSYFEEETMRNGDSQAALDFLQQQVDKAASGEPQNIDVPNLLARTTPEKTEAFLRKALVAANAELSFNQAGKTADLARKLALELTNQMKTPSWGLVNSLDAVELYEALDKKFPEPAPASSTSGKSSIAALPDLSESVDNSGREQARIFYMLGLISKGRNADAMAVAKKIKTRQGSYALSGAFDEMDRAGLGGELADFMQELIAGDLDSVFWSQYVDIAAKAGRNDEMLALVEKASARPDLSDASKARFLAISMRALLAADKVDDAVAKLHALAALPGSADPNADQSDSEETYSKERLGLILANVGTLLQKTEWIDEGVKLVKDWLAEPKGGDSDYDTAGAGRAVVHVLIKAGRGPEAEALLLQELVKEVQPAPGSLAGGPGSIQSGGNQTVAADTLIELVTLYYQAGRYDDVLTLVNECPYWGFKDLSETYRYSAEIDEAGLVRFLHGGGRTNSVAGMVAVALLNKGDQPDATKIYDDLLDREPGLDRGYELLLKLKGADSIPRLDELFGRDQFEERPLIWKGHMLRLLGKPADSEKVLRQAIAIDPSDGEEGKGDRMRVYAELADTLEVEGNKTEADTYREVVKAIRISEDADDFYLAGMVSRAVKMYETGLSHFTDAYCIQSRLAVQLSELGLQKEAEEHYRKAFELMPSSFGRVESHCFGCEGAFAGPNAQGIAEQVFTKFAAEQPNKPQVHYLLGYLHLQQEKYAEARTNLLTAVRLDPDYLNAWAKLEECGRASLLSPAEADEVAFNILRLDPLHRHQSPDYSSVTDLQGLWAAEEKADSLQVKANDQVFPFAASRDRLAAENRSSRNSYSRISDYDDGSLVMTPSRALAQTSRIKLALQLMGAGMMSFE